MAEALALSPLLTGKRRAKTWAILLHMNASIQVQRSPRRRRKPEATRKSPFQGILDYIQNSSKLLKALLTLLVVAWNFADEVMSLIHKLK